MSKPLLWLEEGVDPAPAAALQPHCRALARTEADLRNGLQLASAAILHVPYAKLKERQMTVVGIRKLPILWLCAEPRAPKDPEWGYSLDGMLFPRMNAAEIEWTLQWASRAYKERKRWNEEKEQLIQRLEERKWIDQAKGILCEIKGINESEAYDFLRKQAMNERKRVGDVAASIVKVYQLIHG
ncbi:ANTAR domain-containing response regulator [Cohnella sp. GCM10027633]|uniref:ANTAR domain-containing response regulator n=1 Tax=unclassified Cohnella TaxID=2636738 RepID=UPI003645DB55